MYRNQRARRYGESICSCNTIGDAKCFNKHLLNHLSCTISSKNDNHSSPPSRLTVLTYVYLGFSLPRFLCLSYSDASLTILSSLLYRFPNHFILEYLISLFTGCNLLMYLSDLSINHFIRPKYA